MKNPGVFVRAATGLTREASVRDIFVYNTNNQNIGIGALFFFLFLGLYPGANLFVSILITALCTIPVAFVYAMLSGAMPRSGGDYVFVSRILGPRLGYLTSINWLFWMLVYIGVPAAFLVQFGIAPLFRLWGVLAKAPHLVATADALNTPIGIIAVGTALLAIFALIFVKGTRAYMRVQNIGFVLAILAIILMVVATFAGSHQDFVARFNSYVLAAGGKANAYGLVMHQYQKTTPAWGFSWKDTLLFSTWVIFILPFSVTSTMIGGEIKNARRSQLYGMPGSVAFTTFWLLLLSASFIHVTGVGFLAALGAVPSSAYGLSFTPTILELAGLATPSPFLAILMGILFLFWTYVWLPINFLASTRILLAWSFDRLAPESVSYVSPRTATPIVAIVIVAALGELSLILYAVGVLSLISGIFTWLLSFLVAAIAAVAFPYRKPEIYKASPFKREFLGVPTISIVGVLAAIGVIVMEVILWLDPVQGMGLANGTEALMRIISIGIVVVGLIAYQAIRFAQSRRGIDLGAAFREIPPD